MLEADTVAGYAEILNTNIHDDDDDDDDTNILRRTMLAITAEADAPAIFKICCLRAVF